jgi:hypothetical protein
VSARVTCEELPLSLLLCCLKLQPRLLGLFPFLVAGAAQSSNYICCSYLAHMCRSAVFFSVGETLQELLLVTSLHTK